MLEGSAVNINNKPFGSLKSAKKTRVNTLFHHSHCRYKYSIFVVHVQLKGCVLNRRESAVGCDLRLIDQARFIKSAFAGFISCSLNY